MFRSQWESMDVCAWGCYRLDVFARRILCTTYPIGFVLRMCKHVLQRQCLYVIWWSHPLHFSHRISMLKCLQIYLAFTLSHPWEFRNVWHSENGAKCTYASYHLVCFAIRNVIYTNNFFSPSPALAAHREVIICVFFRNFVSLARLLSFTFELSIAWMGYISHKLFLFPSVSLSYAMHSILDKCCVLGM